jgi:glycogen debranching enzyme
MSKPTYWSCADCAENCILVKESDEEPEICAFPDVDDPVNWQEITREEFQRRDDLINDPSYIAQTLVKTPSKVETKEFINDESFRLSYVDTPRGSDSWFYRQLRDALNERFKEASASLYRRRTLLFGVDPYEAFFGKLYKDKK